MPASQARVGRPSRTSIATLTGHTSTVESVAFSPDGQTLARSTWDKAIRLWKIR